QAAGEAAPVIRLQRGQRVVEQVLEERLQARVAPGDVLGPVQVVGGRGLRDPRVAVTTWLDLVVVLGRAGQVAELGVPDREPLAGPVYALQPVQPAFEVADLAQR